jgi:nitrite reductase/ring-hydroxylating ferredoxin subunit
MTRKDFLKNIGVGAAFVLTVPCLHSCSGDDDGDGPDTGVTPSAGDQNFTVDLDDTANAALLASGGFIISNRVVVARTVDDQFVAASQICSHEGTDQVVYDELADQWFCRTHAARFAVTTGTPENNVTDRPLRLYTVTQNGNTLIVNG